MFEEDLSWLPSLKLCGIMAGWAHVILVGASIVTNAFKDGLIELSTPRLEEELSRDDALRERLERILLEYVEHDCRRASAELNTCIDLIMEGHVGGRQQWCYLLSSDTNIGRLCNNVLAAYLRELSRERLDGRLAVLDPVIIQFLGDPERFNDGLANLFEKIVEIISYHRKQGDSVFVHATGGFKPETAIAVLAANMPTTGAPIFYIHEHFNRLIRIPAMPITFRKWKRFPELLDHLMEVGRMSKEACIQTYGSRIVDEGMRLGWIEEEDGFLRLTAFGELLWRKMMSRGGLLDSP